TADAGGLYRRCRVDLPRAVLRKMALNKLKYPASKVHGSAKKYTEQPVCAIGPSDNHHSLTTFARLPGLPSKY
uniref:Uncharacterized protein n=1 Tax=Neogobius melanostomus TaxID=47308 RepID=A0A8C6V4W5_9GOBI